MDGRARGIDVSHNNGPVNWDQLAGAGITFAFAKASEGCNPGTSGYLDSQFATNWQAMKDAGVIRGAYHFIGLPLAGTPQAQWNDDMHRQIDHFVSLIGPLQAGDLPPMIDLEDGDSPGRWNALITSDRSSALALVTETINYLTAQLGGVLPIIYTGSFWTSELNDPTPVEMPFSNYPLWIAQYPIDVHTPIVIPRPPGTDQGEAGSFDEYDSALSGHTPRHIPQVWGGQTAPSWKIWQFSEYGQIPAIASGYIDLDVFNGTVDDVRALCIPAAPTIAGN